MKTYSIEVTRSGDWWAIEVPTLDGHTQAKRLDQVEEMVRDLIHLMTDEPEDSFALAININHDKTTALMLEQMTEAAERAEAAEVEATTLRNAAIATLHDLGLPNRDVGTVVGVSHQRVAQILNEANAPRPRRKKVDA